MKKLNKVILISFIGTLVVVNSLILSLQDYFCINERIKKYQPISDNIISLLANINDSVYYAYDAKDNLGNGVDSLNIVEYGQGVYYGAHHHYNGTSFTVHLVNSTDLINWTFVCILSYESSMPELHYRKNEGDFFLAHEQWQHPNTTGPACLKFRYYPDLQHLRIANSTVVYQKPESFSSLEGTPSFYNITDNGSTLHLGFHYNSGNGNDRVANCTITNFLNGIPQHAAMKWIEYNKKIECSSGGWHIGGRDRFTVMGLDLSLQEVMAIKDDWGSWETYMYNWEDGGVHKLEFRTHKGSTSFSNPHVAFVSDPTNASRQVLFLSVFIHAKGSKPGEIAQSISYRLV